MSAPQLGELVRLVARSLVDEPEQVQVREVVGDRGTRVELTVARGDIGKIIGREGRTAQCIRTLLQAASSKANRRVHLDILD